MDARGIVLRISGHRQRDARAGGVPFLFIGGIQNDPVIRRLAAIDIAECGPPELARSLDVFDRQHSRSDAQHPDSLCGGSDIRNRLADAGIVHISDTAAARPRARGRRICARGRHPEQEPQALPDPEAAVAGQPAEARARSRDPRHVEKATAADWICAARLRTLPLAVTPILIGTGARHLVDDEFHWVIALFCLIVSVQPADRRQLRERLQRRRQRHRRPPGRPRPAHRLAQGEAPHVLTVALSSSRSRRSPGSRSSSAPSSGGCSPWGPSASSPPGSTPAASGPTATTASANCSCSSSSDWSRRSAPPGCRCSRSPGGLVRRRRRGAPRVRGAAGQQPPRHRPGPKAGKRTLTVLIGRRATRWVFTVFVLAAVRHRMLPRRLLPDRVADAPGAAARPAGDPHRVDLPRPP